jgi:hypothetical protein
MEQIGPDIIERGVQCECQILWGMQFQHLRYILLLPLDVCFCLRSIFTLKIKLNF